MSNVWKLMGDGLKVASQFVVENSPTILTALGICGGATAIVLAIKETPKAIDDIQELEKEELHEAAESEEETPVVHHRIMPRVKIYAKAYWPTVLMFTSSAICVIFANKIHLKRNAALLAAYQLSTMNLNDLKKKIEEVDGKKKLKALEDDISKDKVTTNPVPSNITVIGPGDHLIYDVPSGRYFRSNIENVRKAVFEINTQLQATNCATLNDFYDYLGIDHIGIGNDLGWRCYSINDCLLEMEYSSHIAENGVPCLVLKYEVSPLR